MITACAFIHQQFAGSEKLFWPRRAETKKFLPGKFELPGGHIEFSEDIITGLKRELLEEFQFEVDPDTLAIQRGFAILSGTAKFNIV